MDPLKGYQHERLELADAVRDALYIARDHQDDLVEHECRTLLAKLAEDRFTLAVVGQFSRGKSTLMNAILGADYLPTGVLPMTSVITTVRYGSRPRATFQRRERGLPIEVPLAEVSRLIAQSSTTRAQLQVTDVTIELPAEILRLGIAFVDTPGVGSQLAANTATTTQFLPQADAVVFVTGFDSPLTEAEMNFLREVGQTGYPLFLVVNKQDLIHENAQGDVLEFVAQAARDSMPGSEPRLFGLSALNAIRAQETDDPTLRESSGLPRFEAALNSFLVAQKSAQFLRNSTAQALAIIRRQRRDISLTSSPTFDRVVVAEAFNRRMDEIDARQHELVHQIRERIESTLPTRVAAQGTRWQAELQERLIPHVAEAKASDPSDRFDGGHDGGIAAAFEKATLPTVQVWLGQRSAEVTELAIALAAEQIGRLFDLARSPRAVGAEVVGLQLDEDRLDAGGWSAEDLPQVAVPAVTWNVTPVSTAWSRIRTATRLADFRRRLPEAADRAIAAVTEQAVNEFAALTAKWVDRFADELATRTRAAGLRFTHNLAAPGDGQQIGVLDDLVARLAGSLTALDSGTPDARLDALATGRASDREPVPPAHPQVDATTGIELCTVCERQKDALIDYLSHRQFWLASRQREQELHAQSRGFCALHTWEFYAMASPLGVSTGYAMLADSMATELDTVAADETENARLIPINELAATVATLATPSGGCPVCQRLAEIESNEATRIADTVRDDDDEVVSLCLHHLARVLAATPRASDGRAMTRRLAARLRRDSEDMRSYALKREAYDRGLLTDEESHAHLETLRLLAGDPLLAKAQLDRGHSLEFPES